MNVVVLTGRLVADPKLQILPTGAAVADIRVAVDRTVANNAGGYDTDFIDARIWGDYAKKKADTLNKGDLVELNGTLRCDQWKDNEEQPHSRTYVRVDFIKRLKKAANAAIEE